MSQREKRRLRIGYLPANLSDALDELEKDPVVCGALGERSIERRRAPVSHFSGGGLSRTPPPPSSPPQNRPDRQNAREGLEMMRGTAPLIIRSVK